MDGRLWRQNVSVPVPTKTVDAATVGVEGKKARRGCGSSARSSDYDAGTVCIGTCDETGDDRRAPNFPASSRRKLDRSGFWPSLRLPDAAIRVYAMTVGVSSQQSLRLKQISSLSRKVSCRDLCMSMLHSLTHTKAWCCLFHQLG